MLNEWNERVNAHCDRTWKKSGWVVYTEILFLQKCCFNLIYLTWVSTLKTKRTIFVICAFLPMRTWDCTSGFGWLKMALITSLISVYLPQTKNISILYNLCKLSLPLYNFITLQFNILKIENSLQIQVECVCKSIKLFISILLY